MSAMGSKDVATALSPAVIGNVGIGFDLLGHPIEGPGDTVTVRQQSESSIEIIAITGIVTDLPLDPAFNSAGAALIAMRDALSLSGGFSVEIDKGIALASGMGGSAASAVAAVVAANALLAVPLPREALLPFALAGEMAASGAAPIDNVGPQLLGGLRLARPGGGVPLRLPVPGGLRCVLVHPRWQIETRESRAALPERVSLSASTEYAGSLAAFVAACYLSDFDLLSSACQDRLIEPLRAGLIPGFDNVKRSALAHGALACSMSGSGPSVFAWCRTQNARSVEAAMCDAFADAGLESESWISTIDAPGAKLRDDPGQAPGRAEGAM